jgi:hypothetical protein
MRLGTCQSGYCSDSAFGVASYASVGTSWTWAPTAPPTKTPTAKPTTKTEEEMLLERCAAVAPQFKCLQLQTVAPLDMRPGIFVRDR